jgi:hypothetical protein
MWIVKFMGVVLALDPEQRRLQVAIRVRIWQKKTGGPDSLPC